MLLAYIAAPLFTDAERSFNERLCEILSGCVRCYLPQRDGILLANAVRNGADRQLVSQTIFSSDVAAIRRAELVIAVLDGAEIDAGVAVEIGASWALGKRVLGLRTDSRRPVSGGLNPMVEGACSCVVTSPEALVRLISSEAAGA
jgi:nucleoside 2-deoxyribosyltransferase